jgi:hypothetical protein
MYVLTCKAGFYWYWRRSHDFDKHVRHPSSSVHDDSIRWETADERTLLYKIRSRHSWTIVSCTSRITKGTVEYNRAIIQCIHYIVRSLKKTKYRLLTSTLTRTIQDNCWTSKMVIGGTLSWDSWWRENELWDTLPERKKENVFESTISIEQWNTLARYNSTYWIALS